MTFSDAFVPVAVVVRSGMPESVHLGAVVALGPSGDVEFALGDPEVPVYPRSALKPLQAAAMVRGGLRLDARHLAVVCASHDGTADHVAAVRAVLAEHGLDESRLANTPDLPLDDDAMEEVVRLGMAAAPVLQNCSGKHAGMLATCVVRGWDVGPGYLDETHPLQELITAEIPGLAGEAARHIGVDGCGAPAHMVSLVGLARAFAAIATQRSEVWQAMVSHPVMVGGARRDVTRLMRAVPELMAKDGAEGVYAAAMPDGRAVALKIADGGARARAPVMVAALDHLGVSSEALSAVGRVDVLGHGQPVGEVLAL